MTLYRYITHAFFLMAICWCISSSAQPDLKKYHVLWSGQSTNSSGSMPIGNGDIGANVWVNREGELSFLISKTDAFSEIGRLLKIGKIVLRITPNILNGADFTQELDLMNGVIKIKSAKNNQQLNLQVRVDANSPSILLEGSANVPLQIEVVNQIWRTEQRPLQDNERHSAYGVGFGKEPPMKEKDTVLTQDNCLIWCHQNKSSIWQMTLDNQNIPEFNSIGKDPLLFQNFGAIVGGENFKNESNLKIKTILPATHFRLNVVVLKMQTNDLGVWKKSILNNLHKINKSDPAKTKLNHQQWWKEFWNRHYIIVESEVDKTATFKITQGYILQRYMNACSGRGGLPIKFNGSIFTVDVTQPLGNAKPGFDADYRDWGANFWFQNTRLPYWSMYYSGDFELMHAFFNMYADALPLAKVRTRKYFNHGGAYFPEVITPWGSYLVDNYGWERAGKQDGVSDNMYIRYYWQSGLELSAMMLEYYDFTNDPKFFNDKLLPFVKEFIQFYDQHYKRDAKGKILFSPAQSLESFFEGVVNPLPEIAGLKWVLDRLNDKAASITDKQLTNQIKRMLTELPEIPTTKIGEKKVLSPGNNLGKRMNIEKPELYAVFPYRIYGVDKPDINIAIEAYNNRFNKEFSGWQQDGIFAALLGLTEEAKRIVTHNFSTKHSGSRFPAFWGPNYDWVPDQDHGTVSMRILQNMLVQTEGNKTLLFPAWPKEWDVRFKLNIPGNKTIEGSYDKKKGVQIPTAQKNGQLEILMDKGIKKMQ